MIGLTEQALPLVNRLEEVLASREEEGLRLTYQLDSLIAQIRRLVYGQQVMAGTVGEEFGGEVSTLRQVIESATSGIEHHSRLRIGTLTGIAVVAHAADDVASLIAELLDNATRYARSAQASAYLVHDGSAIVRVEDYGVGLDHRRLDAINVLLDAPVPPAFAHESAQLGLAVVHRLARKHGMRVHLMSRGNAGPGTIAVVTIPPSLLCDPQQVPTATQPHTPARSLPSAAGDRPRPPATAMPPAGNPAWAPTTETSEAAQTPGGLPVRVPGSAVDPRIGRKPDARPRREDPAEGARAFTEGLADLTRVRPDRRDDERQGC